MNGECESNMNDEILQVNIITKRLLTTGLQLLRRLSKTMVLDSQLPSDIAAWIRESMSEIFSLIPEAEDLSDYNVLVEIQSRYLKSPSIMHLSAKQDIEIVLHHLQCVEAATLANSGDIPPQNSADMAHFGLKCALEELESVKFIEKLKGKENGRTSRTAMLNIYGKVCMWTMSMVRMNRPENLLALAGCVRAVLELYVDLNLFLIEAIPNGAEKYFSFPDVEKWRVANNLISMRNQLNSSALRTDTRLDAYLKNPANSQTNIEALSIKLWGIDRNGKVFKPKHWSNMNLRQRVFDKVANDELSEIYIESYYYCNEMVHSTYTNLIKNLETVCRFAWHLFELGTKMFLLATRLINETIEVLPKEDVESVIKKVDSKKLKYLFVELVKAGRNRSNSS